VQVGVVLPIEAHLAYKELLLLDLVKLRLAVAVALVGPLVLLQQVDQEVEVAAETTYLLADTLLAKVIQVEVPRAQVYQVRAAADLDLLELLEYLDLAVQAARHTLHYFKQQDLVLLLAALTILPLVVVAVGVQDSEPRLAVPEVLVAVAMVVKELLAVMQLRELAVVAVAVAITVLTFLAVLAQLDLLY
jgi:hypothetical protein